MSSWHTYPSIYNLGHRYLQDLLLDPVLVEEKIDGSQFSFGLFAVEDGSLELRCRSKGAILNILAPDRMFEKAVMLALNLVSELHVGWTYRGEYLIKPKHNTLVYDRVPQHHVILFDINTDEETYLSYDEKVIEAARLRLEVVPRLYAGRLTDLNCFRAMLDTVSCLGGQKVEGVVIKNYQRFGLDKKALFGKFVSEAFKETHSREWKVSNPGKGDVVLSLIATLTTDARWHKAVQHLRDQNAISDSVQDIGPLIREVPLDVQKEETDYIKQKLFEWAWPQIRRGVIRGLPEWYKEQLVKKQFDNTLTTKEGSNVCREATEGTE